MKKKERAWVRNTQPFVSTVKKTQSIIFEAEILAKLKEWVAVDETSTSAWVVKAVKNEIKKRESLK